MTLTPRQLTEKINVLSDEYFKLSQELAEIAARKGDAWLMLRKESATNAEADQKWNTMSDGKREAYLKIYLKGLEKLRGAHVLEFRANNGTL